MASSLPTQQQSDLLEVAARWLFASRHPHLDWRRPSEEKQACYKEAYLAILASIKEALS